MAIDSLKNHHSQPAVIALTDGGDNASVHQFEELIAFANQHQVPIYIIGLGNVNSNILEQICNETKGFYYHTNDPKKLTEIYENIKRQLRSIYELDYMSNEDNSYDSLRRITFYFTNDTLSFNYNEFEFELPQEVVKHLEIRRAELAKKQAEIQEQEVFENNLVIGFSVAGVLLLGIGAFVIVTRKKKKQAPKIITVFPNPFLDQITINYLIPNANNGLLRITNLNGSMISEEQISPEASEFKIDLSELESGTYLISLLSNNTTSNVVKVVKK